MNDEVIIEKMIVEVEKIVRQKVKNDFVEIKPNDKKSVAKEIILQLEKVMENED